jgi:hypothetical protein
MPLIPQLAIDDPRFFDPMRFGVAEHARATDPHFQGDNEDFDESLTGEMMLDLRSFDEFSTDDAKEDSRNRRKSL